MESAHTDMAKKAQSNVPGDRAAQKQLSQDIYEQLRTIARYRLGGRARTNLNTTVLVHEAYLRIADKQGGDDPLVRARFFALASKTMRNLLIDYLRERKAAKRGGGMVMLTLEPDRDAGVETNYVDVLAVEEALQALAEVDPRLVEVVECKFFAGMDYAQIALAHDMSERTVRRDWRRARAFLRAHLDDQPAADAPDAEDE
jgi:RNA polymerase sigma factor (TIGR02999 family)